MAALGDLRGLQIEGADSRAGGPAEVGGEGAGVGGGGGGIACLGQCNPSWRRGTEPPCAGEVSYSALLRYCSRLGLKLLRRNLNWRAAATAAQNQAQANTARDGATELSQ